MRIIRMRTIIGCTLLSVGILGAQTFDTSANASFKGNYYLRQLLLSGVNDKTGAIGRARSLIGTATLDGAGNYTFTGTLMDTQAASSQAFNATGTFMVGSNGLAQMQNPLEPKAIVDGGVGLGAFVGSSTEATFQDFLAMIPAGTATVSNNSLLGSYRLGALEFLQGKSSLARNSYFTLTSTGNGQLGNVAITGSAANLGNVSIGQTVNNVSYSFSQAAGSLIFPLASGTADAQLLSGTKTLYISADGNLLLGGSPNGFDMFVGIRATPAGTQPRIAGTFYIAGLEQDATTLSAPAIDAFYGSLNGTDNGLTLWHQRFNAVGGDAFDNTFSSPVNLDANGASTKLSVHYDVGANGRALILAGRADQYTLALGIHADDYSGSGVFLNPLGITNAAGFAPITNSVAPGEIVSLFGTGLAGSTQSATGLPLSSTLGGVQVTVNGRPAPLFFVSEQQINIQVPYNLPEDYATFRVTNNGVSSSPVTVYANNSSPAVFTLPPNGVSSAAALHSDFSLVTANSPARRNETILIYLTGLGTVKPEVADGAAAPSSPPLSTTTAKTSVSFGAADGAVSFSGLAPGFVGLYQLNVKVPATAQLGNQFLSINTPEALNQEATIAIAAAAPGTAEKAVVEDATDSGYRPRHVRKLSAVSKTFRHDGARRSTNQ